MKTLYYKQWAETVIFTLLLKGSRSSLVQAQKPTQTMYIRVSFLKQLLVLLVSNSHISNTHIPMPTCTHSMHTRDSKFCWRPGFTKSHKLNTNPSPSLTSVNMMYFISKLTDHIFAEKFVLVFMFKQLCCD